MTALHLGVSGGHIKVVEELASRADPSAINAIDKVKICITMIALLCQS